MRRYVEIPPINRKVAEIRTLNTIKTVLNPRIKLRVVKNRAGLTPAPPLTLPRMLRYDGIKGSIQGEKNERSPATNTRGTEGSVIIYYTTFFAAFYTGYSQKHVHGIGEVFQKAGQAENRLSGVPPRRQGRPGGVPPQDSRRSRQYA
jgi:hypothetical protein